MQSKTLSRRSLLERAVGATAAIIILGRAGVAGATSFPVVHSAAEWRRMLGAQRYAVLREAATEPPFSSPLLSEHRQGTFLCAGCANAVFSSATNRKRDGLAKLLASAPEVGRHQARP
jgi:peptide-methionine (R)-S-oxide reductase